MKSLFDNQLKMQQQLSRIENKPQCSSPVPEQEPARTQTHPPRSSGSRGQAQRSHDTSGPPPQPPRPASTQPQMKKTLLVGDSISDQLHL